MVVIRPQRRWEPIGRRPVTTPAIILAVKVIKPVVTVPVVVGTVPVMVIRIVRSTIRAAILVSTLVARIDSVAGRGGLQDPQGDLFSDPLLDPLCY